MSAHSVTVSLEPPDEFQVQEITFDGQEKCVQPLSMSEHFTKSLQKIDFSKVTEDEEMDQSSGPKDVKDDSKDKVASFQPSLWPWDSVRNKLKSALTEVMVLHDVLNIAKDKRYVVLDGVTQEPNDLKPITALVHKKKALASAATILLTGVEKLRSTVGENARLRGGDFHQELLQMRQTWRLKKMGNSIFGDLSYRSAGSRFPNTGVFEVTKNEKSDQGAEGVPRSALKVSIPSELKGVAYIQVTLQRERETLTTFDISPLSVPESALSPTIEQNWQQKLEAAQNVLFCKELFAQLAREAVQMQLPMPTLVVGNQMIVSLFPDIKLFIRLVHTTIDSKTKNSSNASSVAPIPGKKEHKHVLEHSLHQLLREVHYNYMHLPMPHPTTAPLGVSRKRQLAGPEAFDRQTLYEASTSKSILEQIMEQSQHYVLRWKTLRLIDSMAAEMKDPLIISHTCILNSPAKTSLRIMLVSHGYENICKTCLMVQIGVKDLKVITKDGRSITLSYELDELRSFILSQASQHQINAMQQLAKLMGWKIVSLNFNVGIGPVEPTGCASSLLITSPNSERTIAIRSGPHSGIQVHLLSIPEDQDFYPSTLVRDRKWHNLAGQFKELHWNQIDGKSFISKMELVLANLTCT